MLMGKTLTHVARLHPERTALIQGRQRWTYGEFNARVNRLAHALTGLGLAKGDKLAVWAKNSHRYLEAYYACAKAGLVLVPVNYRLPGPEVSFRLEHSDAAGLLLGPEFLEAWAGLEPAVRARMQGRVVLMSDEVRPEAAPYEELIARSPDHEPAARLEPDDPLVMSYTSGTTGRPKAALSDHRAGVLGHLYKIPVYRLTPEDVTLNPGPFWHAGPRNFTSLALFLGGAAVIMTEFHTREYLENVERHRVTNGFLVPTMFQAMLNLPDHRDYDLSSLRCLLSGGSPLPTKLRDACLERLGPVIHEFYSSTETLVLTDITTPEMIERPRSVGRPTWGVEIKVVDDQGRELPDGEVGEIFVKSPTMFSGYWSDRDKNRETFREGWFTLGDMGRFDSRRYLYLVDRKNDTIISGGENIYPTQIEEVLRRHPAVAQAAVIGVPHEYWGEAVKAVVVLKPGAEADAEGIIAHCAGLLADYQKPKSVDFVDELPVSPMGKVLRRVLREKYREN